MSVAKTKTGAVRRARCRLDQGGLLHRARLGRRRHPRGRREPSRRRRRALGRHRRHGGGAELDPRPRSPRPSRWPASASARCSSTSTAARLVLAHLRRQDLDHRARGRGSRSAPRAEPRLRLPRAGRPRADPLHPDRLFDRRLARHPRSARHVRRRLAVNMHLVSAGTGALRNLATCVERCHLDIDAMVAGALRRRRSPAWSRTRWTSASR